MVGCWVVVVYFLSLSLSPSPLPPLPHSQEVITHPPISYHVGAMNYLYCQELMGIASLCEVGCVGVGDDPLVEFLARTMG